MTKAATTPERWSDGLTINTQSLGRMGGLKGNVMGVMCANKRVYGTVEWEKKGKYA